MSLVGDGRGEEDLCHVRSGGRSVTHVPSGGRWRRGGALACTQGGTLSDTCPQLGMVEERSSSVTHVPSGGWWRRGGSVSCTQWGMLSDTCPQWGMVEERRICVMYAVGDTHSHMSPVGDGGGEEELCHVRSGGRSVTHVPSGGWERRGGSVSCTQWGTLSDTCP